MTIQLMGVQYSCSYSGKIIPLANLRLQYTFLSDQTKLLELHLYTAIKTVTRHVRTERVKNIRRQNKAHSLRADHYCLSKQSRMLKATLPRSIKFSTYANATPTTVLTITLYYLRKHCQHTHHQLNNAVN